jgi:DNA helicase-2/ATP-dependent DNA helicase PcrA
MVFRPRPAQEEILKYERGMMGISAVPGSGKTYTLSALAAQIVTGGLLEDDQEVLVVTLVNSAVSNFAARVAQFVEERGQLPSIGYRVRTLHGLAHDIVREHPGLVGLSDDFQIIDEREADQIRREVAEAWLRSNPQVIDGLLSGDLDEKRRAWVHREHLPQVISDIGSSFIRRAKDRRMTPAHVLDLLERSGQPLPLAEMGLAIYADYQRALAYRGAVDFDDLVRLAFLALSLDEAYRQRLCHQWPYILEDEAQDSSEVQEELLRLLVGASGNWVRVGDPNQAIYETFTTANPRFLLDFLKTPGVQARHLPNSGRSTPSIILLANHLIDWSRTRHPVEDVREALTPPHILPTPPGDPQPNPPDLPEGIRIGPEGVTPREEVLQVAGSLVSWLPAHQEDTVAVLVPRNTRGFELIGELKRKGIPCVELLKSSQSTRETAGALGNIVTYLAEPGNTRKLSVVYRVWRRGDRQDEEANQRVELVAGLLRRCRRVEDFLWPLAESDWLGDLELADPPDARGQLEVFRDLVRRWQGATLLPIDQLILTLAQDLFLESADLAVAHKLAGLLRRASENHPDWQLPELASELAVIAKNERRFMGLSADDTGFDPQAHRGKVVVTTVHKAKGLEWDRVYMMSVNNYDFPSGQPHDRYIAEKWFARDGLNLEAETLAQLEGLLHSKTATAYEEGEATRQAQLDYAAERLRLLYVGITRARRELLVTWNTGRKGELLPATPLIALRTFWEEQRHGPAD